MATTITIVLNDQGQMSVDGLLADKIKCYGMLEMAKEVVVLYNNQQAQKIVQPVVSFPALLNLPSKD